MIVGVIIIFLGILFLLENIIPTFEIDFALVWPVILIIIAIGKMIKERKLDIFTSMILLIGIWYLLYNMMIIKAPFTDVFWPVMLIVLGISIVWNNSKFKKGIKKISKNNASLVSYYGIFSGVEERIKTEDFKGANLYSIFGGIDLDISKIELKEDITINIYSIFGGTDLRIPENVNIKINASAFFGSNENKASNIEKKGNKTIYINCVSIFGGTEIK